MMQGVSNQKTLNTQTSLVINTADLFITKNNPYTRTITRSWSPFFVRFQSLWIYWFLPLSF